MIIQIGHENFIEAEAVVAVLNSDTSAARRLRQAAQELNKLIDSTAGRKARSLIVLRSNQVVLSWLQPAAIKKRFDTLMRDLSKERQLWPPVCVGFRRTWARTFSHRETSGLSFTL